MMTTFLQQTRWQPDGEGRYHGALDASWGQGRALFGGILTGAALEAMADLVGTDRPPRAVTTSFIGPAAPGTATMTAQIMRAGRALTTAEARIEQGGAVCVTVQASFGAPRPSNIIITAPPHSQPDPDLENTVEMPYLEGITPRFTQHFGYRWEDGRYPFSGSDVAISSGWCRHRTRTGSVHAAIVGLLDAWPAPMLTMPSRPIPASTVSWTAAFVDVPSPAEAEGWWYFRALPVHSSHGYATTRGMLYAPDGRLAAHMDQLVVIFDS
jgi:acyl-CoA thioesterase